jgi:hypothetical protein
VTYLIEYLGEFEFIFETVLCYVSGDQIDYFEAKKTESKISCLGTFKGTVQQKQTGVESDINRKVFLLQLTADFKF